MRTVPLWRCWLITMTLALAAPVPADDDPQTRPDQPSSSPATPEDDRSAGPRVGDVGDNNRVHFRSPINVLSHLQVNIQITIGAPSAADPPASRARGDRSRARAARPAAGDATPTEARTPRRPRTPQQVRRRFGRFDTDADGRLSRDELQARLSAHRAARLVKTRDTNSDDHLSLQEWSAPGPGRDQRSSPGG